MLWTLLRYLVKKKITVDFGDLARTKPISPLLGCDRGTPIDRYYIERFLEMNSPLIKGRVLEIGESTYSQRFGGEQCVSRQVLHARPGNRSATIVGDLTDGATIPRDAVDCFICTQTFNFIYDVEKAVAGAHQLLAPGGVLLATVGGISQISRYDMERWGDFWRFTTASVQRLFTPLFTGGVEIKSFGNVAAACAFLQGVAVEDLPDRTILDENDPDYQVIITIIART